MRIPGAYHTIARTEAAIVLGGGRETPDKLNVRSMQRVQHAAELYSRGYFPLIVASGGVSFSSPNQDLPSESALMREALLLAGVPADAIRIEEASTDTLGNLFFSRVDHIDRLGIASFCIVTSDYHMARCQWITHKVYGPNYCIIYERVDSGLSDADSVRMSMLEQRIHQIYGRWLDNIQPGDLESVRRVLALHHPGHAPMPDYTRQEFAKLLYGS